MPKEEQVYTTDEITFKEAVHTGRDYLNEIKKNFLLIILFCLPFLAYNLYKHFNHIKTYPAELTFMISDNSSSNLGGLTGVLGQLGLPSGGEENLDKILELSKSLNISHNTFFENLDLNGTSDYIGNHIINILEAEGNWYSPPMFVKENHLDLTDFRFSHDSIPAFTLLERKGLKRLHAHLIGNPSMGLNPLLKTEYIDNSGIMKMTVTTYSPKVSVATTNSLYEHLREYYIQKSIEKQSHTFDILRLKNDSILAELKSKEYQLANFKDRNLGLFAKTDQLTEVRLSREVQKLSMMYGEVTKNMEIADYALQDNTPFIQLVDRPFTPIPPKKSSIVKSVIVALFIGIFFALVFIVCRKMFREALK